MTAGSAQYIERLTRNNAVLLLVDHQVGCIPVFVTSISFN
jgi:hypothetical protein